MKSSAAAALLAYASAITDETTLMQQPLQHSLTDADETSLMQQQSQRSTRNQLSVSSGAQSSRGDSTAKLLETAVTMMKNGVTPDVITFVDATNQDINDSVLVAIQDEHDNDQAYINSLCQDFQNAVDALQAKAVTIAGHASSRLEAQNDHHSCRADEAYKCARSRRCEEQLRAKWVSVRHEESRMREIHGHIHDEWCIHPPFSHIEGAPEMEAWLTNDFNWAQTSPYPILNLPQDVIDFREVSVTHFTQYREQKIVVERAWELYNEKLEECAILEDAWEAEVPICDEKQNTARAHACTHATENRAAREQFGQEWSRITRLFDAAREAKSANEAARKNEWETLKIVQCLLDHVHSSVITSIETGAPCPTIDSDPDGVTLAIEDCHIVTRGCGEDSLTHHLCLDWCDPPTIPDLPPVEEPACTPAFIAKEQAQFLQDIQASYTETLLANADYPNDALDNYDTLLSPAGWAGCAPPLVCVDCAGSEPQEPCLDHLDGARTCHLHEEYLSEGQSNQDTFRCLDGTCISQAGRCNGHNNCADGSDETGCDADNNHFVPAYLTQSSTCPDDFHADVHFRCASGQCIDKVGLCNGIHNCADESDEQHCSGGLQVTVEATSGRTATVETLSAGVELFHDRRYNLDSPGHFTGKTFIKYSNDDKSIDHEHVMMKLRALEPLTVFIIKLDSELVSLPWLAMEDYQTSSLTGVSFSGVRETRDKEWDASLLTTDHFAASSVWSKTFPAGTISIPGNNGGNGGFLIVLDRPGAEHHSPPHTLATTAAPVTEPEPDPNCGPLPGLTHAQWTGGLEYRCEPGFSFDGTPMTTGFALEIECHANGLYTPVRACMPINDCLGHSCGAFGTCRDEHMDYTCDCTSGYEMHVDEQSGEKICGNIDDCLGHNCGEAGICEDLVNDYQCNCGVNSGWTHPEGDLKTCERVECGEVPIVDNVLSIEASGLFPWTRSKAVFSEVVDLTCKPGYSTNGQRTGATAFSVTCQADGTYSAPQQCVRVPVICPASALMISLTATTPQVEVHEGQSATYTCNTGHAVADTGATTFQVQCLESGRFSSMSTCRNIDDCEGHSCGSHGRCVDGIDEYTCECESGFVLEDNAAGEPTCGNEDDCGENACGGNGVCHDLGGDTVGEFRCECDAGYQLQGDTCVAKTCTMPAFDYATSTSTSLPFGATAVVDCIADHDLGNGQTAFNVRCNADGAVTAVESNSQCIPSTFDISGRIKSALNLQGIPHATLVIAGQTITADAGGRYSVSLPAGSHTYSLSATSFITSDGAMTISSGANEYDISMSPVLNQNQWRLVLTWGDRPTDLDSHLQFPKRNGEQRCGQMYYANRDAQCAGVGAKLDLDDVNSYGPETTTLEGLDQCVPTAGQDGNPCKFIYKVKNYSGHHYGTGNGWQRSEATVKLYNGDHEVGTYEVNSNAGHKDNDNSEFWSVLSIDSAGNVLECSTNSCL